MTSNYSAWPRLILVFLLLHSFGANGAISEVNIAPKTCVVIEQGNPCHMQLKINYILKKPQKTCIWLSNKDKPEQCFNRINVAHLFELSLTKDTQLMIKAQDEVLEEFTIQIATYQPIDQRKRRGLHWNLL